MIKHHLLIIIIVAVATFLRVWQINSTAIFFGDAAHDLLSAAEAVTTKQVPLLGIASSVPRFKQGPVTVWLEMLIFAVVGYNLLFYSVIFAFISVAAVIGVYELGVNYLSKRTALLAALLVAVSPLAVAHGRVVYHITPIPLMMTLFLWVSMRFWQKPQRGVFWLVLAWCGLFQFELALTPLILIIPYLIWRTKTKITRLVVGQGLLALVIGLLPQILFDLTHDFQQLGGFATWVAYRIASAGGVVGSHALANADWLFTAQQFALYFGRVMSFDNRLVTSVGTAALVLFLLVMGKQWHSKTLPPLMEVVGLSFITLVIAFVIHQTPSEAYFPPFIILIPMLLAWGVNQIKWPLLKTNVLLLIGIVVVFNVMTIARSWFINPDYAFYYSYGVGEQRQIVTLINERSSDGFTFATTQPGGSFASYFDNLRWLAQEQGVSETENQQTYYIEPKDSPLQFYPSIVKYSFPTVDVYSEF